MDLAAATSSSRQPLAGLDIVAEAFDSFIEMRRISGESRLGHQLRTVGVG